MTAGFIAISPINAIREGRGNAFFVGEHEVAVFIVDGMYHAVENLCPHQHVPLLAEGSLEHGIVTCPMHGWRFDVTSGCAVAASGTLTVYETHVEDGMLYVRIPENEEETYW